MRMVNWEVKSALNKTSPIDSDRIVDFEKFIDGLEASNGTEWKENWNVFEQSDGICFYRLTRDEFFYNVHISFKILVNQDMRVLVYRGETESDAKELDWILRLAKLESWSQFYRILEYYQTEPPITEKSNSFHLIKQALESLNKISKSRYIDEIIDPIKARLVMALDRVDPVSDIVYAAVKLEPDDKSGMDMYDEQDYHDELSVDEMITKRELAEVEMVMEDDDDEMVLDPEKGEFVRASDVIVEAIEDDADVDVEMLISRRTRKSMTHKKRPSLKKEKRSKETVLLDCEHCDRKQMTKEQLKNHFYTAHVS